MRRVDFNRREFLKTVGLGSAAAALFGQPLMGKETNIMEGVDLLSVDPRPKFDLSPYGIYYGLNIKNKNSKKSYYK